MSPNSQSESARSIEQRLNELGEGRYLLRLYVAGMTLRSTEAISRLKAICDEYLSGRYELEIIDIYQHPGIARGEQILAAPTLIKKLPPPVRRLVGNLTNRERVLMGLDVRRIEEDVE